MRIFAGPFLEPYKLIILFIYILDYLSILYIIALMDHIYLNYALLKFDIK